MGFDSVEAYLEFLRPGLIVLCRTSNPGGSDLQNLTVEGGRKLYQHVAGLVAGKWNTHGQNALVVGATFPQELADVRSIVGDLPLLVPGIGAQGGDVKATVSRLAARLRARADDLVVAGDPLRRVGRGFCRRGRKVALATRDGEPPPRLKTRKPSSVAHKIPHVARRRVGIEACCRLAFSHRRPTRSILADDPQRASRPFWDTHGQTGIFGRAQIRVAPPGCDFIFNIHAAPPASSGS